MSDTRVVFIDQTNWPVQAILGNDSSLVEYGDALWITTHGQGEAPNDAELNVYKSTDGGETWTPQDQAGHPTDVSIWTSCVDGSKLIFFYQDSPHENTGDVWMVEFDMAALSDNWGTPISGGPTASSVSGCATIEPGKYVFVYYGVPSGVNTDFQYGVFESASFGASGLTLSSGMHLGDTYGRVGIDSTYAHVCYVRWAGFFGPKTFYHRSILLADLVSLSSEQSIYTPAPAFAPMRVHSFKHWEQAGAVVFGIGWYYSTSSVESRRPAILIANEDEAEPSWTVLDITFDAGNTPAGGNPVGTGIVIGADGNLRMVWTNGVGVPGQNHDEDPFGDILYRNVDPDTRTLIDANDIRYFDYGENPVLPEPDEESASTPGLAFLPIGIIPSDINEHGFAVSGSYTLGVPAVEDSGYQASACFLGMLAVTRNFSHIGGFYTRKAG